MTETTPYSIPKERGRWRAITLAALVHALLFGFLWLGVRWQNEPPAAVEAEVWDMQVKEAAPRPEPQAQPEVKQVKPEPKPVVKVAPPPPKVVEPPPQVAKPDIVLEQEKKRKELERKKRLEDERLARQKREADERRIAKENADAEQKKIDAEQLKKSLAEKKLKEETKRKEEAEKKRKQEEAYVEMVAQTREAEMRRIAGGVAGTGGAGDAPKSQGSGRADPGYADRVGARIKSNTIFNVSDSMKDNPPVEYAIELLPDGSLRGTPRKLKSSGIAGFDEAVQRAIERSQPYPPDKSGRVPPSFILVHKPKDQ